MKLLDQSFSKDRRLLKKKDFFFSRKRTFRGSFFLFVYQKTSDVARIGISIKKKYVKPAPSRNYLKRTLRELFRKSPLFGADVHVILLPREEAHASLGFDDIFCDFKRFEAHLCR